MRGWIFPFPMEGKWEVELDDLPSQFTPGTAYLLPFVLPIKTRIDHYQIWPQSFLPHDEEGSVKVAIYDYFNLSDIRPWNLVDNTLAETVITGEDPIQFAPSDNDLLPGLYYLWTLFEKELAEIGSMYVSDAHLTGFANNILLLSDGQPNPDNYRGQAKNYFGYRCEGTVWENDPPVRLSGDGGAGSTALISNTLDYGFSGDNPFPAVGLHLTLGL